MEASSRPTCTHSRIISVSYPASLADQFVSSVTRPHSGYNNKFVFSRVIPLQSGGMLRNVTGYAPETPLRGYRGAFSLSPVRHCCCPWSPPSWREATPSFLPDVQACAQVVNRLKEARLPLVVTDCNRSKQATITELLQNLWLNLGLCQGFLIKFYSNLIPVLQKYWTIEHVQLFDSTAGKGLETVL